MKENLSRKILAAHLLEGTLERGEEIVLRVDQTLTQDSTGTMVYLQLEAMGVDHICTERSVAYIDHNMLQSGFENADDHAFIRSCAEKYGLVFSKPGGGICHQVHLERFGRPGILLIGSDSHTPTNGGLAAIAIGAGGLDVAVGMAKGTYNLKVPKILKVELTGCLPKACNAKDVILEILKRRSVKGGVGIILEYVGEGVKTLSVTDRATICNMGAELGATTSIFPSDERTLEFLTQQGRPEDYIPLAADEGASYDEEMLIALDTLEPLAAQPDAPDAVASVAELEGIKVDQVCIGSCTNSSYSDLMRAAAILKGQHVAPHVDLTLSPGSSNILRLLAENGALATFIAAGARILESGCGPCIGMGQSPKSGAVSLRTFNRNFKGRSGTMDARVYLVSPETAAASAIRGVLSSPASGDYDLRVEEPKSYGRSDNYFIFPEDTEGRKDVVMGPNIKPFPLGKPLEDSYQGQVIFKTKDNVTTDDICPSNAKLLPFRSNIPYLSQFCFKTLIDDFAERAERLGGGIIVGGDNYGQGSSREHAALIPLHLGVRAVLAKSFARIHRSNLINSGILPLVFENPEDYEKLEENQTLILSDLLDTVATDGRFSVRIAETGESLPLKGQFSEREREVLKLGGYLNFAKQQKSAERGVRHD